MKRIDWQKQLSNYTSQHLNKPFAWGVMDCTSLAIGAIEAMSNQVYEKPELTYTNMDEAVEFSKTVSLYDEMKRQMNAVDIKPGFQTIGDMIFCQEKEGYPCVYFCIGGKSVTAAPDYGVRAVPTKIVLQSVPEDKIKILRFF